MTATSSNPRQPRLRASCDGCFHAKVKCSKTRPICSRCLTCGFDCRYSPSRSGRLKSDGVYGSRNLSNETDRGGTGNPARPTFHGFNLPEQDVFQPLESEPSRTQYQLLPCSIPVVGSPSSISPSQRLMSAEDIDYPSLPWTPRSAGSSSSLIDAVTWMSPLSPSQIPPQLLFDDSPPEASIFGMDPPPQTSISYVQEFPSPDVLHQDELLDLFDTSGLSQTHHGPKPPPPVPGTRIGSCNCFTTCLQSLQALHNASRSPTPPFYSVLSLNRKAVEGCAAMLACHGCMSGYGTHTRAMVLAIIIGNVVSFYNNASQSCFENDPADLETAGAPPGEDRMQGSVEADSSLGQSHSGREGRRWLELEVLERELGRLEKVYARFRGVFAEFCEDGELSKSIGLYLEQALGSTLDMVSQRVGQTKRT